MIRSQIITAIAVVLSVATLKAQESVIDLYDGVAPGSEEWQQVEAEGIDHFTNSPIVYNVTRPTLTVYAPETPNGTALVICPGGGFHWLSIESEGSKVAEWFAARGVTCFVLKYRLVACKSIEPTREIFTKAANIAQVVAPVVELARADAQAAIRYVREHAADYQLDPARIGIVGFSAGGTVVVSAAYQYDSTSRPDFVAAIYPQYDWAIKGDVPVDAPPLFILAATNDPLGLARHCLQLYEHWQKARRPVELHLYSKGGHGFGMFTQDLPSDRWYERMSDWMVAGKWLPTE